MRFNLGSATKRIAAGVIATAVSFSGLALIAAPTSQASQAVTGVRLSGANRYGTAAAVATTTFPTGVNDVILASGENFPDGLAAATLAGAYGAPILLTPTAGLAAETTQALATLKAKTVHIVGGPAAVSAAVATQLTGLGYTVDSASTTGATRYDTAALAATNAAKLFAPGTLGGKKTALLATGQNFPDALSGGTIAYSKHLPLLLTNTAALSTQASTAMTALGIQQVIVLGGTAAVSAAAIAAIPAGITTITMAGATRFDTAAKLATLETTALPLGFGYPTVTGAGAAAMTIDLVTGLNFPDALAASVHAGANLAPVLLMASVPPETTAFLTANAKSIAVVNAIGGTAVIPAADFTAATASATTTTPTATIAATQGTSGFKITFSETMLLGTFGAIKRNNAAIATCPGASCPLSADGLSVTVALATPLAVGDTIGVTGFITSDGRAIAATNATVVADTAAPTVVVINAQQGATTALGGVIVVFNKAMDPTTALTAGNYTFTRAPAAAVPAPAAPIFTDATQTTVVVQIPGGTSPLAPGDIVTVSGAILGANAVAIGTATTKTVVADASPPVVASAKFTEVDTQASLVSGGAPPANGAVGNNTVVFSAKSAGTNGNFVAVAIAAGGTTQAGPLVTTAVAAGVTTINVQLGNGGAAANNGAAVAAAVNAFGPAAALVTAAASNPADVTLAAVNAADRLRGGTSTTTITVVYNKTVRTGSGTYNLNANGDGLTVVAAPVTTDNGQTKATVILTLVGSLGNTDPTGAAIGNGISTGAVAPIVGTSKLQVTGSTDIPGNTIAPTSAPVTT